DELFGLEEQIRGYPEGRLNLQQATPVQQPAGACLMLRRPVFEAIGGFDERFYPAWFEDVDLCLRLAQAGQRLYFLPQARFNHGGGESVMQLGWSQFLKVFYLNQRRYFAKHCGSS